MYAIQFNLFVLQDYKCFHDRSFQILLFQYRKPIGKLVSKYNGFWCDTICPSCKKNESLDQPNMSKNTNLSSAQNGNIQTTLRADKTSSFYSPTGFSQASFHQIQQQNGNIANYSTNGESSLRPNVQHNYKLSTLAHPLKVRFILL